MAIGEAGGVPGGTMMLAWRWVLAHSRLVLGAIAIAAVIGVGAWIYRLGVSAERARTAVEIRTANLARDSAEAAGDTTRVLWISVDSQLQVVERRAVQLEQERDQLDELLGFERRVTATLFAEIVALRDSATSVVTVDSADVRHGTFHVRSAPYTVSVAASLPPPPDGGRATVSVELDPFSVTARVGCGELRGGVRPSTVAVEGPSWARLTLGDVVTDPDVCSVLEPNMPSRTRWFVAGGVTVLVIGGVVLLVM